MPKYPLDGRREIVHCEEWEESLNAAASILVCGRAVYYPQGGGGWGGNHRFPYHPRKAIARLVATDWAHLWRWGRHPCLPRRPGDTCPSSPAALREERFLVLAKERFELRSTTAPAVNILSSRYLHGAPRPARHQCRPGHRRRPSPPRTQKRLCGAGAKNERIVIFMAPYTHPNA
jgi:hypothetical protein